MTNRTVIVIESLAGGGAQHVSSTLANTWADRGDAVTVITFLDAKHDIFKLDPKVRRIIIGGTNKSPNPFAATIANLVRIRRLRAAIISCKAEVVVSFLGTTNVLTILATRGTSMRVVVSERNDPSRQSLGKLWDILRNYTYKLANRITANSKHTVSQLSHSFPRNNICWTPNPIRVSEYKTHIEFDKPYIIAAGRLHRQKGFDILLRAFAEFHKSHPCWRLFIVGEGDERPALESLSHSLHIAPFVDLVGFVKNPFPYYRGAVFMTHPARYEGLPNVVLEAMSVGKPAVVTDTQPGILDFVQHEKTGLVVPGESVPSLAAAMCRLSDDESLRVRLGGAAREAIRPCLPDQALKAWDSAIGEN